MSKHFETEAIRTQLNRSEFLEHSVPLYLTSSFVFEGSSIDLGRISIKFNT